MFSGGIRGTLARTRSPSTDGKPSRSSDTKATDTSPLRNTRARAVSSPLFSREGLAMPMPRETGKNLSGVITRTAAPAWISARASESTSRAPAQAHRTSHRRNTFGSPLSRDRLIDRPAAVGVPPLGGIPVRRPAEAGTPTPSSLARLGSRLPAESDPPDRLKPGLQPSDPRWLQ